LIPSFIYYSAGIPFISINSSPQSISRKKDLSTYTLTLPSTIFALNTNPQKSKVYICSILFNFILLWSSSNNLFIRSISQKYPFTSVYYTYWCRIY